MRLAETLSPQVQTWSVLTVNIKDVSVVYPASNDVAEVCALDKTCLDIPQGKFFTLIGPSGCGKSTLLNVIGGQLRPTTGEARVNGKLVKKPLPETSAIVFQEYSLFPWRTVKGNVEAGLEFRGVPKRERAEKALYYLRMVGLENFANAYPRQLSGGMKQRVAISRALCLETPVLLMDEPFGALDEQTRMVLGEELSRIFADTGKTIVLVTHSLAEAVFLSDQIGVMSSRPGRIVELIDVPVEHPRTSSFMTSALFHELRDHLFTMLHDEMRRSVLGGSGQSGHE